MQQHIMPWLPYCYQALSTGNGKYPRGACKLSPFGDDPPTRVTTFNHLNHEAGIKESLPVNEHVCDPI